MSLLNLLEERISSHHRSYATIVDEDNDK